MNQKATVEEVSLVTVGGLEVLSGDLRSTVELIGTTSPQELVNVMIAVPAEVKEVKVSVGDYVNEGDVLFSMDTDSMEDQLT